MNYRRTVNRKGGTTLLIIIALVVLILIFLIYGVVTEQDFIQSIEGFIQSGELSEAEREAKDFMGECVETYSKEAISIVERQGGYTNIRDIETIENIGYISMNGEQQITLENVEENIESYLEEEIKENCFSENFQSYSLEIEDPEVDVKFYDNYMDIENNWFVTFSKTEESFSIKQVDVQIETDFKKLFEEAEQIATQTPKEYEQRVYLQVQDLEINSGLLEENKTIVYVTKNNETFITAILI